MGQIERHLPRGPGDVTVQRVETTPSPSTGAPRVAWVLTSPDRGLGPWHITWADSYVDEVPPLVADVPVRLPDVTVAPGQWKEAIGFGCTYPVALGILSDYLPDIKDRQRERALVARLAAWRIGPGVTAETLRVYARTAADTAGGAIDRGEDQQRILDLLSDAADLVRLAEIRAARS
jgi:hypothetical protein